MINTNNNRDLNELNYGRRERERDVKDDNDRLSKRKLNKQTEILTSLNEPNRKTHFK